MNEYDYQNRKQNEYGSDLFQEYLNEQEEEQKPEEKIGVSEQVEQDLRNYEMFEKRGVRRTDDRRKTVLFVGGIAAGAALVIVLTSALVFNSVKRYDNYEPAEYYAIEEPYIEEEYEDPYEKLGNDLANPSFMLESEYYALPLSVSQLMDNSWTLHQSGLSAPVQEVSSEPAVIRMDSPYGGDIEVTVVSPTGETVPIEEAEIIGLYVEGWETNFTLPGYIGINDSSYYLEEAFRSSDVEWVKTGHGANSRYTVEAVAEEGNYTIEFNMEDDAVESITLQLEN